jgi:squalene-hopene/tetraprenyl-beta-curcumene cyclase
MTDASETFHIDAKAFQDTLAHTRQRLLAARNKAGYWDGKLSSSALSTATAVTALSVVDRRKYQTLIEKGLAWLTQNINPNGGWGDSVKSSSNISTTVLVWAAFAAAGESEEYREVIQNAQSWIQTQAGSLETADIVEAIYQRYGRDRTFSVPILTMAAISGRLGQVKAAWRWVRALPFELAAFPQRWWRWLRLPVVSYALPALIAMGQVRFKKRPPANPITRLVRYLLRNKTLQVLKRIQPENGGFLEAAPLTGFVVMSLAAAGYKEHEVVRRGVDFLVQGVREDGSWPIDTNLATWLTTLSVNALANSEDLNQALPCSSAALGGVNPSNGEDFHQILPREEHESICRWLLSQQYRSRHPYTGAAAGGWAWTDLPGGVPDADDTAGALLALYHLGIRNDEVSESVQLGIRWLLGLQNRDGGFPTFCRGWGKLPFDRSCADITAHALRAMSIWIPSGGTAKRSLGVVVASDLVPPMQRAIQSGINYLIQVQAQEGYWLPLWFGNQWARNEENRTYGTAKVVLGLVELYDQLKDQTKIALAKGIDWLLETQREDGGWGGDKETPASIEETGLAMEALIGYRASIARVGHRPTLPASEQIETAVERGTSWLIEHTKQGKEFEPTPIGFYFARLWYYEKLYPVIFTLGALEKIIPEHR